MKEKYNIEYDDCKDYLDTFSYRDYLIYENRQISMRSHQARDNCRAHDWPVMS